MWKKTSVHILYGIKIIALWCLIANLTIFGYNLVREFKANVTVEDAVLTDEYYDYYPGERAAFDADLGGRSVVLLTPPDKQVGDIHRSCSVRPLFAGAHKAGKADQKHVSCSHMRNTYSRSCCLCCDAILLDDGCRQQYMGRLRSDGYGVLLIHRLCGSLLYRVGHQNYL